MYFYILNNEDWKYEDKLKYGYTKDYNDRLKTDQHSYRCEYIALYKYEINEETYKLDYKEIDNIISKQRKNKIKKLIEINYPLITFEYLFEIKDYLINHNGGTEFIRKDGIELLEQILLNDFKKLGINVYKIPKEEWNINIIDSDSDSDDDNNYNNDIYQEELRDYQKKIKNEALLNIIKDERVYISLATGGGKSRISFEILNEIAKNNSTIIILTPRINICEQNIQNKYLKLLSNFYKIYDKTNINEIGKDANNLICCCINSYKKIVKAIINKDLRNVLIWFDEAHYGIDNWIIDFNEEKEFLIKDNKYIRYRLYTSASPNKDFITKNNNIFGEFVNPIKIKDLMRDGYLCKKLNPYIYKDEIYEDNKDNKLFVNFIINNSNNKKFGLCFTNSCDNALELFNIHLDLYKNDNSIPKPFLLLNSNKLGEYIKDFKIFNEDSELFRIETFEINGGIAYIVKMYSMGYDNPKIDLLIFKDPKMSYKDIIQSIGRGMRPYGNKETDIIIPVYINQDDNAKSYDKIKEVLKYILLDIELNMTDIKIIDKNGKKKSINISIEDKKEEDEFIIEIQSILYEIQKAYMKWTKESIIRQLKYNDIHNIHNYLIYIKENPLLNLPENIFEDFPLFDFNETYKNNSTPYYSRNECIKAIENLKLKLIYNKKINKSNNKDLLNFLIKNDDKIPNECLWTYYGGKKKDFIIFV